MGGSGRRAAAKRDASSCLDRCGPPSPRGACLPQPLRVVVERRVWGPRIAAGVSAMIRRQCVLGDIIPRPSVHPPASHPFTSYSI